MPQCPECESYMIEFDLHFQRPRCYSCGWLPSEFKSPFVDKVFELCNQCWGYPELRGNNGYCNTCRNKGKYVSPFGREVVEVIRLENEFGFTSEISKGFVSQPNIRWAIFGDNGKGISLVVHSQKSKRQVTFEFAPNKPSINIIQIDEQMRRSECVCSVDNVLQLGNAIAWLDQEDDSSSQGVTHKGDE